MTLLQLPNLDDRRWADLVEDARALIPQLAPEWTDHNVHDPGITVVELLASIAELDIYQLNQISDRHRRTVPRPRSVRHDRCRAASVPQVVHENLPRALGLARRVLSHRWAGASCVYCIRAAIGLS